MLLTNSGDSLDRIEELGIVYRKLKSLRSRNPISLPKTVESIREIIKENNIDIVHTHHRLAEFFALQAVSILNENPPATVFTSLSLVNRKYIIEYRSDRIIAVSNSIKNMLLKKFKVETEKISLIPNFADKAEMEEIETITSRVREDRSLYTILAIGRFHHEKNFETLLKALNILKDPVIELILVGEGNKDMDYRKYISLHGLNVEIIVPQKNLLRYFRVADLCVLPSARDPFPNFMLQAGLHKKPFIGANVDGIGELINDGVNGLLFKSGNEIELAEKISFFKRNRTFADECAGKLHLDVLNNYTQEQIIPQINTLYEELIINKN
jgi:L-malate glycosyltransferase